MDHNKFKVTEDYQSSLVNKNPVMAPDIYNKTPIFRSVKSNMNADFTHMIGKPFFLGTYGWSPSSTVFAGPSFPSAVLNLSKLASAAFDLMSLYRVKACFEIQVGGTPQHSGCLLAAVSPEVNGLSFDMNMHSMQCAPHAELYANSANTVCIPIPWYSPTKLRWTPSTNDNMDTIGINPYINNNTDYAGLYFRVISPLGVPTGGTSSVVITVSVKFEDIHFYMPKATFVTQSMEVNNKNLCKNTLCKYLPLCTCGFSFIRCIQECSLLDIFSQKSCTDCELVEVMAQSRFISAAFDNVASAAKSISGDIIDRARGMIKEYTGLHNPNVRIPKDRMIVAHRNNGNYVDDQTFYYKLDPYVDHMSTFDEFYGDTEVDEGLVSHMCSKEMLVRLGTVTTSTTFATPVWSAPISPLMFSNKTTSNNSTYVTAPIDKLTRLARHWSGDLNITIKNYGSSFHMYKLLVVREYYPHSQALLGTLPLMTSVTNLPSTQVEFSSGGQMVTIPIPQASIFDYIPVTTDYPTQQLLHGRIVIYLLQPLVVNGSVSTTVQFGVYLTAGENFRLYGYATDYLTSSLTGAVPTSLIAKRDPTQVVLKPQKDPDRKANREVNNDKEAHNVYEIKDGNFVPTVLEGKPQSTEAPEVESCAPVNVCVTPAPLSTKAPVPNISAFRPIVHVRDFMRRVMPLPPIILSTSQLSNLKGTVSIPVSSFLYPRTSDTPLTALHILTSMFSGFRGGFKVKLLIKGTASAVVNYVPPCPYISNVNLPNETLRLKASQPLAASGTVPLANQVDRMSSFRTKSSTYLGPTLETPDYYMNQGTADTAGTNIAGEQQGDNLAAVCEFEFEIPYMNVCRYISTVFANRSLEYAQDYYTCSLGYITVGVASMYNTANAPILPPVTIYPYVGCDDGARFVYQARTQLSTIPINDASSVYPAASADSNYSVISGPITLNNNMPAVPDFYSNNYTIGSAQFLI